MARLIALEWDTREARVAVGNTRGNEVVVEQAFAVDLSASSPEDSLSTSEISQRLGAALTSHGVTGGEALVAMPRSNIELRLLSLPPAPPEERPEMVRFQAMQAFTAIGEEWPLDFVELDSTDDSTSVLAAVVSPNQISLINKMCASGDLKPRRLVLRPYATASLLKRSQLLEANRCRLIVDVREAEADLTAVFHGQVVFMRSVRLPNDPKVRPAALAGELRRTIGAAQNQMGGTQIEQIVICGGDDDCLALQARLSASLSLDVVTFDPLAAVRVARSLRTETPDHPGRFASLFGLLADEAAGAAHEIDFLNPRKRPEPPSRKRRNLVIAAAAALVLALGTAGVWWKLGQMDQDIALLNEQTTEMEKALTSARALMAKADAVEEFTAGDITWLDEIREVARHLPDSETAILEEVTMGTANTRGGTMVLKGNVTTSAKIEEFEDSLRYNQNIVSGKQGTIDRTNANYPWLLDAAVIVLPDVLSDGRSKGRPFRDQIRMERDQFRKENKPPQSDKESPAEAEAVAPEESTPPGAPPEVAGQLPSVTPTEGMESQTLTAAEEPGSESDASGEATSESASPEPENSQPAIEADDASTESVPDTDPVDAPSAITETQPS